MMNRNYWSEWTGDTHTTQHSTTLELLKSWVAVKDAKVKGRTCTCSICHLLHYQQMTICTYCSDDIDTIRPAHTAMHMYVCAFICNRVRSGEEHTATETYLETWSGQATAAKQEMQY